MAQEPTDKDGFAIRDTGGSDEKIPVLLTGV